MQNNTTSKTVTVYKLAQLVSQYNGERGTAKQLAKLCKAINKTPQVYISFAQLRGLI
jgi:hypothetical protein